MIKAKIIPWDLNFKKPAGTSRGILTSKPSWFIHLTHDLTGNVGIGECSLIPGLSIEDENEVPHKLNEIVESINSGTVPSIDELYDWPAIQFALETALHDIAYEEALSPFPGDFSGQSKPIPINGLIWMGDKDQMLAQIEEKLKDGFKCVKLKIGAIDFESEIALLKHIREKYTAEEIEIRVDANGAFSPEEAMDKLTTLSKYEIHSIEQPIKQGQWKEMALLCANTPIPIALDEELIGVNDKGSKIQLLQFIRPQYIILKPSLIGGFISSDEWIEEAEKLNIGWWATSALESNIGLNAIAQWVSQKDTSMPQGLGTGKLFTNNLASPLIIKDANLVFDQNKKWEIPF